jgi:signal peptidase II
MSNTKKNSSKPDGKKEITFFSIVSLAIILDQIVKRIAQSFFDTPIQIIQGFLQLSYVKNTGAGFGILHGQTALLTWFSVIIIGLILYNYDQYKQKTMQIGFALILGGAISNLIDRAFLRYVVDYIDFSFFPTFNIADSCITVGGILIILFLWKGENSEKKEKTRNSFK